jgi:signal transduction histidine kinase
MRSPGEDVGVGRWYIAMPPLLLVGFLIGLFLLAAAGQARLESDDARVRGSQQRQEYLSEYLTLITEAETGQRGYLLTGDRSYLAPYETAATQLGPTLGRLRAAYGTAGAQADRSGELEALTRRKMAELGETVALYDKGDIGASRQIVLAGSGKKIMVDILGVAGEIRSQEAAELSAAAARAREDLHWSRLFTAAGAVLDIGLVLLAMRLVYGDMRRRTRQATDLREQKAELERQVDERTRELTDLSTHLQGVSEQEKASLSRELHDELGGLLVAARMDLSWLQQRLTTDDPAIEQRFKRIHESLSAGVEFKRRVVEELRPTLLDNMGLFSALRWQLKETCRRSGLSCRESIPDMEPPFNADAAIGIFRIAQEALTNILKHARATTVDLSVSIHDDSLVLRIADDGIGIPASRLQTLSTHGLASMRHRITNLGGLWDVRSPAVGGTVVTAVMPMNRLLAADAA